MGEYKNNRKIPPDNELRACPSPRNGWSEKHHEQARDAGYDTWDAWVEGVQRELGQNICGGKARHSGGPCRLRPLSGKHGNGRCRFHGGRNAWGPTHAAFKTGRHSEYLPSDLLTDYQTTYNDPEYLSLRSQISVSEAREAELLRQLADNAPKWSDLEQVSSQLTDAVINEDTAKIMQASTQISELIASGRRRGLIWDKIERCQTHGRQLKTAEAKIMADRDMTLDKDRALALFMWLISMLREKITDRALLTEISTDIRARIRQPAAAMGELMPASEED